MSDTVTINDEEHELASFGIFVSNLFVIVVNCIHLASAVIDLNEAIAGRNPNSIDTAFSFIEIDDKCFVVSLCHFVSLIVMGYFTYSQFRVTYVTLYIMVTLLMSTDNQIVKHITAVYPENGPYTFLEVDGNVEFHDICVGDILKNGTKYYTLTQEGERAEIHIVPSPKIVKAEKRYLRTDRNNVLADNLGELPVLDWERVKKYHSKYLMGAKGD